EHIPAVTCTWEVGGAVAEPRYYTSPRIEELLGFTVDEWHRSPDFWMSRLHPDDRPAVLAATLRSESTGEGFSMEYRYLHKDGRVVWVLDEAVLLSRNDNGEPSLFQGVMVDVTTRRETGSNVGEQEQPRRGT
ncbi:MAG: PAS domain-containing protein, partial [Actinomycetota bacterium]